MNPEVEIEVIKSRIDSHDESLDRLGEIASYLKEIVIEHKTKIASADRDVSELKVENASIARDLKAENASIARELKHETTGKIDEIQIVLKADIIRATTTLETKIDDIIRNQKELVSEFKISLSSIITRVSSLERYKWIIFGGAGVLGFLIKLAMDLIEPMHDIISKSPH